MYKHVKDQKIVKDLNANVKKIMTGFLIFFKFHCNYILGALY